MEKVEQDLGSLRPSGSVLASANRPPLDDADSAAVAPATIRRDKVRFAIGFYLLSGWLPWAPHGEPFGSSPPSLSLCGAESGAKPKRWILCCGHTLTPAEGERWIAAELAAEGEPDRFGRRTLVKGPELERWIAYAWDGLRAKTWGAQ